jgi:hypothetical protein
MKNRFLIVDFTDISGQPRREQKVFILAEYWDSYTGALKVVFKKYGHLYTIDKPRFI